MNRPGIVAAGAFLVVCGAALGLLRDVRRPSIRADGVGYYAPLASVCFDGDLDLHNELGHLEPRYLRAAFMTPDGELGDPFPVGPAVLWTPAVLLARQLPAWSALDAPLPDPPRTAHPAFAPRYARALLVANVLLVLLGGAVLVAELAASNGVWRAVVAGSAGVLGTPVFYYVVAEPSYGHASSYAVAALLVAAAWCDRRRRLPLELLGLAWGVVTLVRAQDAVLGLLLLPRLVEEWRAPRGAGSWRTSRLGRALRFAWPAALAFLPQAIFWQRIYGVPLLVPPGPDLLPPWKPHLLHLLFSTWNGMLPWTPVLCLGLGLWFLVPERPVRFAAAAVLALTLYSSSLQLDWWGGAAFGPRRLVSLVPLATVGLAHGLAGGRLRSAALGLALLLLCAVEIRLATYKVEGLLPANPGNAADYVRHYVPGTRRTFPYRHLDYPRLAAEAMDAERMLRARKARGD